MSEKNADIYTTTRRELTRRGVMWVGLKCDVRCGFCYDDRLPNQTKTWIPFTQAVETLDKFRYFYGNEFVDFMGGEPTLHPRMVDIVKHAAEIGLRPTIITHGMHLSDKATAGQYKDSGIFDFLVSIHGIGDTVRRIHGAGNHNYERQMSALDNLRELGIPFRFNCVPVRENVMQLTDIVRLAAAKGARVVNFLTFNPYFEWAREPAIPFQLRHSEAAPHLSAAIEEGEALGVEINVRYFPLCQMPGQEKNVYTGYQLPYDPHEWDFNSWYDQGATAGQGRPWYRAASDRQRSRHNYVYASACSTCAAKGICDGVHSQYLHRWGDEELRPLSGDALGDPCNFINSQVKYAYDLRAKTVVDGTVGNSRLSATQFDATLDNRAGIRAKVAIR